MPPKYHHQILHFPPCQPQQVYLVRALFVSVALLAFKTGMRVWKVEKEAQVCAGAGMGQKELFSRQKVALRKRMISAYRSDDRNRTRDRPSIVYHRFATGVEHLTKTLNIISCVVRK